jgi:CheY-like chemotaxis protein
MLSHLGHSVTEAATGQEALELLDNSRFDLIVTDLSLPDISGEQVAARAVKQQPGLRVIFATGYDTLPGTARAHGLDRAVMLQKPYGAQQVATALKTAIS